MQITRQADYAVRAVRYLADQGAIQHTATREEVKEKHIATSIVAVEMKIPPSFLAKIVSQLSIAGLLRTSRGAHGGILLARDPKEISLLDVVEAIDGPILLNECVGDPAGCTFNGECPIHPIWVDVQKDLVDRLRRTTFNGLMK